jgi:ferric-dicitrate binding protein FerR (iron transport regulator)
MIGRDDELQSLCESAIEGRLSTEEGARLERLVLADPGARRFYVEYLHQHGCLQWAVAEPSLLIHRPSAEGADGAIPLKTALAPPRQGRRRALRAAGWLAAAAALVVGVWLGARTRGVQAPATVATLVGSKACKWESGSLPTEIGARLAAGRLRLAEGLARIAFAGGAEVTLEAPADLELVSPRRCVLHAGRVVAKVPPAAIGFTMETPTAVIADLGTEFGVNVSEGKSADVQVFDGRVDVRHRGSGRLEHMRTGENLRFAAVDVARFDPLAERPAAGRPSPWSNAGATRLIQLSTASGRGKDAYIRPPFPMGDVDTLLLVKNTVEDKWSRKAYLGLDLAPIAGLRVVEAQLSLALASSGLGFASEVPDATFAVYGLTDESLDDWDETAIRWENAPANQPGGAALDPDKVVLLGRFEVMQGVLSGTRDVSGPALVDFLNRDTNGLATLILVRETKGSGRLDLVHGFAAKRHPNLPPPTLKLTAVPARGG